MIIRFGPGNECEADAQAGDCIADVLHSSDALAKLAVPDDCALDMYMGSDRVELDTRVPEDHDDLVLHLVRRSHTKNFFFVSAIIGAIKLASAAASVATGGGFIGSTVGAAITGAAYGGMAGSALSAIKGDNIGEGFVEGAKVGGLMHAGGVAGGMIGTGAATSAAAGLGAGPAMATGIGTGVATGLGAAAGASAAGMDSQDALLTGATYGLVHGVNSFNNAVIPPDLPPEKVGTTAWDLLKSAGSGGNVLTTAMLGTSLLMRPPVPEAPATRRGTNNTGPAESTQRNEDGQFTAAKTTSTPDLWNMSGSVGKSFTPGMQAGYPVSRVDSPETVAKARRNYAARSLGGMV